MYIDPQGEIGIAEIICKIKTASQQLQAACFMDMPVSPAVCLSDGKESIHKGFSDGKESVHKGFSDSKESVHKGFSLNEQQASSIHTVAPIFPN